MRSNYKTDLISLCESVPEIIITFNIPDNDYECYNLYINMQYNYLYINMYNYL